MISESEILGLAYLEAMALGIIPIGSRNEGIDGIIVDGVNGFLCEAGNAEELASIMIKIRKMSREKLNAMSAKAKRTAVAFSDYNVAKQYIEGIVNNESN
ncbi:MAG: UDP-D-galactose:(glucosyl)lipopolysaccharide-1,6-D-galactosyltransferase [Candidatus Omnitrophica bacterium ADurb.Bin292]|nr:MAG: UDP-D-galactose:(glucosyl)lipopolysaccharide-1,6-D-galactosyltransferase [Candidatus Omnitrophica bacterium ADurb.Bin292]